MTLCGWASIDENGRAHGGKAGDQTGREVKTGAWYDFGQTEVFRWKDKELAEKFATIDKYWCNDADVGYDQNGRTTLGKWCKEHKYSYKVNIPVETDCSRMVADGINCTMKREVIKLDQTFYTGNMSDVLMKTGLFTKLTASKYVDRDDYLMIGDIINNPARHVIVALENGSKVKVKKSITTIAKEVMEGKWGNDPERSNNLKKAGYDPKAVQKEVNKLYKEQKKDSKPKKYTGTFPELPLKDDGYRYLCKGDKGEQVKRLQRFLKWYGTYKGDIDGNAGNLTDQAIKAYQKKEGLAVDGFFGKACLARAKKIKK